MLLFHGYLLRGTGSNIYNAELAAALVRLGHEVHLVSQERHADEFDFVGAVGDWDTGELVVTVVGDSPCTVYRPDIGGLLPVYVSDRYEGVAAHPFQDLSDDELDSYLEANVRAVGEVVSLAQPEVGLANHLVMGPAILARALSGTGIPYAAIVHGSALEYTVKPFPRFLPYAREGVAAAETVLVGSSSVAHSLWAALDDPGLPARTRIGTPGVDVRRFRPDGRGAAEARLRKLADEIERHANRDDESEPSSAFDRDDASTADALRRVAAAAEPGPIVTFVGKLILAKGIDLVLAGWPLVLDRVPDAHLAVVGFGAYRDATERWLDALSAGDLDAVRALAQSGQAAAGGPASKLRFVLSFLDWLETSGERDRYLAAARTMRERVILTGLLDHDELADVLPLCEAMVVPSTFPEAFGMVAVEAAACGALPLSAAHSGLAEVSRALSRGLPERERELISFPLGRDVVRSIAGRLTEYLSAPPEQRAATSAALVQTVTDCYSWEGVARGAIEAARGELDMLESPLPLAVRD